jgi:cobyrinic acid a,c-diamide synthase
MKKLLIGATHSGAGKTTVTLGIMRALSQRGLLIQPFKVGPDYIDTGWHSAAVGSASRNLDAFMLPPQTLSALFARNSAAADISVIEGVMGLYDGFGLRADYCSSAGLAKQLTCPVILVVDGKSVSTSLAATVQGFIDFDRQVNIAGVIINRVSGDSHYRLLKQAIEHYCAVPVLGRLPVDEALALPSRHLGLIPAQERQDMAAYWQRLAEQVERYIDLDRLLALSECAAETIAPFDRHRYPDLSDVVIAVARDEAFHFYYQDNLDLLSELGANIIEFSPLRDAALPDCHAVYIGGGFPEVYAQALSANSTLLDSLRGAHRRGTPIYAECGGLMYLGEALIDAEGQRFEMAGLLAGQSEMSRGLKRFGYCQGVALTDTLIAEKGAVLRGHEFHHSQFTSELPACFAMSKVRDGETIAEWAGGYQCDNTFASYLHLHFYQSPAIISRWLGQVKHG